MEAGINTQKFNLINGFTYPSSPNIEEKINYFVDCIDLFTESQGMAFCSVNLNTRLLIKALKKIALCQNSQKRYYIKHYYDHYRNLVSIDNKIIKEHYLEDFKALNTCLNNFISNSSNPNPHLADLIALLTKIELALESEFFEKVIEMASTAVLCKERLTKHGHKKILEECANALIVEFYSIGYSPKDVENLFSDAVKYNRESIGEITERNIYKIPVPPNVAEKINESYEEYKKLVVAYLETVTLPDQFKNLIFIYRQALRQKKFVFRIKNLRFRDEIEFTYYNATISKSVYHKYATEASRNGYKEFFKENDDFSFCEVEVLSGNNIDALQKAVVKANEALNYINFNYSDETKKAYIDLSQYVIKDAVTDQSIKKFPIGLGIGDEKHVKYLQELLQLENTTAGSFYIEVDKIYFQACNASIKATTVSDLWRYCEALFLNEIEAKDVRKKLIDYYCKKTKTEDVLGAYAMTKYFTSDYYYSQRHADLGMADIEYYNFDNQNRTFTDYISVWNEKINHPIINEAVSKVLALSTEERYQGLYNHFYKILKGAYIERNLFQHSNIIIDEIQNVWFYEFANFIGRLRLFIIEDIKARPTLNSVEELFITEEH